MTTRPKPHIHARDHEHGGADTIRIHYESVGTGGGSGGGIMFDTVNTGGWLEIRTTDTAEEGIYILDTGGGIYINADGPAGMQLLATDSMQLVSSDRMDLSVGGGAALTVQLSTTGSKLEVTDHLGHPLLRVTESGTFHIKTGAAWVADL